MSQPKRKRGRPASIDTTAAMSSVIELFRSKGYDAVSLDDLSDATGLSRPSLYRAFGNKLSMYVSAMDAFSAQVAQSAVPALRDGDDLEASIAGFYDEMLEIYYRDAAVAPGCLVFATAPSSAAIEQIQTRLQFGIDQLDALMRYRIERDAPDTQSDQMQAAIDLASNTLIAFSARAKSGAPHSDLSAMGRRSAQSIVQILGLKRV